MKYYIFLEEKDSTEIADFIEFDSLENINEYLNEAYFPDTWDYRIIEGVEKTLNVKVSIDATLSDMEGKE